MNWLDKMLSGMGVPNIAGEQNASLAANPAVQAERGPNGSFDPTRLGGQLGPDAQPGIDYLSTIYDMQRQAAQEATKPPTQTGLQFLGNALSAASVPVAYAQGNEGFARQMTGRTGADIFNGRVRDYEDAARKTQMELAGTQAQGYGEYGLDYLKDKREKTATARKTLAGILAAGRKDDGTLDEASLADAEMFANTNGFKDEWEQIKSSLPKAMPSPVGQGQGATSPGPESVRPLGANLSGMSAMAQNVPGAAPAAPGAPQASTTFQPSQQVQDAIRKAQRVGAVDPERGKMMLDLAKEEYKSELAVHEAKIKSGFDSRSGKVSTTNTFDLMDEQGNIWPAAPSADGTFGPLTMNGPDGKPLPMPDFTKGKWRYVPKSEQAGIRSSMVAQGTAQGTAAASIPKIEDDYEVIMDLADRIKSSPGLKNLTGKSMGGLVWSDQLPDFYEETGDARGLVQGLDSKAYITAFESLKGAGAITEKEGEAATLALSRLKNMRVSDSGYMKALNDFVAIVKRLRRQAYEKASKGLTVPGQQVPQRTSDFSSMSDDDFLKSRPGAR